MSAEARPVRTYLAVPAHRRRLVQSAAASAADAVFLDLEDAVPPGEKAAALDAAVQALTELDWGHKSISVRLNAVASATIAGEIDRLAALPRLDAVIVPKAEHPADIAALAVEFRAKRGNRPVSVALELLIETALGLVNVEQLAVADPLVSALHLGVGDFAASIGARSPEIGASPPGYRHAENLAGRINDVPLDLFAYPMMRLLVAARAFGLQAIDGPCGAYRDEAMTMASARKAAAMGFDGKQVIHPSQIEPTRDAFIPSSDEVAFARKVLAAMEDATRNGHGAVTVDGKMIDYANLRMIRRVIQFADGCR